MPSTRTRLIAIALAALLAALLPGAALAHCDALDGPVVSAARAAIAKKDLTPVLKWIGADAEPEVRSAFTRALAVRGLSPEAKELADLSFFETVVRLHRAKEGAPYAGLKPAGTDPGPAVRAVDHALEEGTPEALERLITERASRAVRYRFGELQEARRHAEDSVEAGRKFTGNYALFTHWIEALYRAAEGGPAAADAPGHVHH